jgi:cytochrome d ubiquinol oxidase subunit II
VTPAEHLWAEGLLTVGGLGIVVYVVTGGADLGVGLWNLLSSGPRKAEQEKAIRHEIAPIWEANHVWLIFVIVILFSAFPPAFSALSIALHVPVALALVGLVFRGSAYVFHAYGIQTDEARTGWSRLFAWSSVVTPVCLGLVVGGVSSGDIRVVGNDVTSGFFAGWTTPFAFAVGVFSLGLFALLAAVYLAADTEGALSDDFRRRALAMEAVCAVLAAVTFVLASRNAPALYENLRASPFTWPIQLATAAAALATIFLLVTRRVRFARFTAPLQVAFVVIGWGLALRGHFILPDMTLARATPHPEVLPAIALAVACGTVVLVPSLFYLFWVFKRGRPQ